MFVFWKSSKSQRCLDLQSIQEDSFNSDSITTESSDSTRQPLAETDTNSTNNDDRQQTETEIHDKSPTTISFSLVSETDQENLPKRTIVSTNLEQPRKKQKKTTAKVQITGQKMITNFFQSKS